VSAVALRPASAADEPFLRRVFACDRASQFAPLGLDGPALDALLAMQFTAQDRAYRAQFPDAAFDVVLVDGRPAGRLYVARGTDVIHVIDITLLPEFRGQGAGTRLLEGLMEEARDAGTVVALSVVRGNPAVRLYQRLGFELRDEDEIRLTLEWRSPDLS
jgi:ribosomal protein S18 acetylase RimI-like enzyme